MAVPACGAGLVFPLYSQLGSQSDPRNGLCARRSRYCTAASHTRNLEQRPGQSLHRPKYLERLQNTNIKISMDGRGRARDHIFTERLWRTLQYEEVYLHEYASPKKAYHQLANYIRFYNLERPHQALDYLTPAQVYAVDSRVQLVLHSTLTNQTTLK